MKLLGEKENKLTSLVPILKNVDHTEANNEIATLIG